MRSFRNLRYVERYENVVFDLETALITHIGNNAHQKKDGYRFVVDNSSEKDGYRFVVDNSGEVTPFDWYNARISLNFKVNKSADGSNIANDHNVIVNGSHSFIRSFDIKLNGRKVYDCNEGNHVVNIKNVLEYSPSYAESTATNEFYYLDTNRNAEGLLTSCL